MRFFQQRPKQTTRVIPDPSYKRILDKLRLRPETQVETVLGIIDTMIENQTRYETIQRIATKPYE